MTDTEKQIAIATDALRKTVADPHRQGVPAGAIKLAMAQFRGLGLHKETDG